MTNERTGSRFVIASLPRSGSTSLVRLLNLHSSIRCLVEPFHPGRYEGRFHRLAIHQSVEVALKAIWTRWTGIKHVCEASGWPFMGNAELNDRIMLRPECKVIFLVRRNLLQRLVSNLISRQTGYWMGTAAGFRAKLETTALRSFDPGMLRRLIEQDRQAIAHYTKLLAGAPAPVCRLDYEDLFSADRTRTGQLRLMNELLAFLDYPGITEDEFAARWERHLDPAEGRWANPDVYRRIPGIDQIEQAVGCDETGWLFRPPPSAESLSLQFE